MVRPVVTETTEDLYERLGPLVAKDEETGWTALHFAESHGRQLDAIEQISRDREDRPGWSIILDPELCPVEYLPWLAQFTGVVFPKAPPTEAMEAEMRAAISAREGQARGRPATMVSVIQRTLIGAQTVIMQEKHGGDAYALRIATYASQTPDSDLTLAAIMRQKPAGIWPFTYDVLTGATYAEIDTDFGTYADLDAAFTTYADQEGYVP